MYIFLKGVIKFRAKNYSSAEQFFTKAANYTPENVNELFCQYYGQTLLSNGKIKDSFEYLSKAYTIYTEKGWRVANDEEYRLTKDTLNALNYLEKNFNLKVDKFNSKQTIVQK